MINKQELNIRLKMLNEELDSKITLYIAGGLALVLNNITTRTTHDIDVFKTGNKTVEETLMKYDINYEISNVVNNTSFKKFAIKQEFDLSNITVYSLSNDYLFVLKCLAFISPNRNNEKKKIDLDDIKLLSKKLGNISHINIAKLIAVNSLTDGELNELIKEIKKWV